MAPKRRRLGGLPAGVGIDLGVEHQHVDVAAATPARGRARHSRCRRPSRRRRRSRCCAGRDGRRPTAGRRAASFCPASASSLVFSSATRMRCARISDSWICGAVRIAVDQVLAELRRQRLQQRLAPGRDACRRPAGSRGRIRHCPRTANSTRPARALPGSSSRASPAGCRHRSRSSRWRWRPSAGRRTAATGASDRASRRSPRRRRRTRTAAPGTARRAHWRSRRGRGR